MGKKKKNEVSSPKEEITYEPQKKHLPYKIKLKCKNMKQKEYSRLIENDDVEMVFVKGQAGCGKTYVAVAKALQLLQENDKYEKIVRNQNIATNYYTNDFVDSSTRLQKTLDESSGFLTVDLTQINDDGALKGGNYIFLIRYCDDDNNDSSALFYRQILYFLNKDQL